MAIKARPISGKSLSASGGGRPAGCHVDLHQERRLVMIWMLALAAAALVPRQVFPDVHLPRKKVLVVNEDEVLSRASYSLEDFFWTGSGDGPSAPIDRSHRPTIIRTTTVVATVFLDSPSNITPDPQTGEDCVTECPINPFTGEIDPTRVGGDDTDESGSSLPDPKYWLLTVLRAPAAPLPPSLSKSLAKLYQRAFQRQQQQHLGIITTSSVSPRKKHHTDPISIHTESIFNDSSATNDEVDVENVTSTTIGKDEDVSIVNISSNENSKAKRSTKTSSEELNVILLKKYSTSNLTNYNNALDIAKREIFSDIGQPLVQVFLHNLTKENKSSGDNEITVIYWVSVGGRPVPARTAARDMKLLDDSEVVAELGYPITTKAEPYLKSTEPANGVLEASNMRDIYLIIAASAIAIIILLSLLMLFACRNRRKSSGVSRTSDDKQYMHGKDNKGYLDEQKDRQFISVIYPDKNKMKDPVIQFGNQRIGSAGSSSTSIDASDLSQMTATLQQRQRLFEKHMKNEYAVVNKKNKTKNRRLRPKKIGIVSEPAADDDTLDEIGEKFVLSSPSSSSVSSCDSVIMRRPQGVVSPTSYLSMPSVKSFPRGNAVEPLSRVLEPLSVKHLDMDSDSPVHMGHKILKQGSSTKKSLDEHLDKSSLIRMGSMNKDPGVIGPIVWDMHKQKLENESQLSYSADNTLGGNITKMRQRFSELVDDAFSLFGSGGSSPKTESHPQVRPQNTHHDILKVQAPSVVSDQNQRRHSSKDRVEFNNQPERHDDRPHTGLPPRPPLPQYNVNPTLAWGSNRSTPMIRSSSAGRVRRPTIDVTLINPDPAIPLIQAMKKELEKLPGTSDA